jgi:hypothetical protein
MNILVSIVLGKLLVLADLIQSIQVLKSVYFLKPIQVSKNNNSKPVYFFKTYTGFKLISQYLNNISNSYLQYLKLISQYLNNIIIFTTFIITSQQFNSVE